MTKVEVIPTGALLKANTYIVVEVPDAAVVRAHASVPRYRDCCCEPNIGGMGHKDLMVALAPDISSTVVVVVNTRAIEVLQNNYFAL